MEDLHELSREPVRDTLDLAEDAEGGPADPEHVASKAEALIDVLGVISALSDQDIDHRVTADLEEVVHRFSGTRAHQAQHTQGVFDIPSAVEHQVLCGLPTGQIAVTFGVSKRTTRRPMKQNGLRWRFVVHGEVDGFSRLVVYLVYMTVGNNRAHTVLQSIITAEQYGLPSRERSDKGGENADVAEFMIRSRDTDRNSHITGRSVHNQRIKRMWKDVYEHALDLFYQIFTSLEDQGTLNPDNEVHRFALHRIFLPLIQQSFDSFRDAWDFHGLRTERNQSPQQLWRRYREQGPMEDPSEVPEEYGINWNGPHSLHGGAVSVSKVQLARELSDEEVAILPAPGVSVTDALRLYGEILQI